MSLDRAWMFSVGFVLVVGTLGCGDKSAAVSEPGPVSERDAAIAAIRKLGGYVGYDEDSPERPIISVSLMKTGATDADLEHLKGLTSIQRLWLHWTQLTDAGLEHLKGLTRLQTLNLQRTQVTGAGLEHLKGMTNLQSLNLLGAQVTDAGFRELRKILPNTSVRRY